MKTIIFAFVFMLLFLVSSAGYPAARYSAPLLPETRNAKNAKRGPHIKTWGKWALHHGKVQVGGIGGRGGFLPHS